MGRDREATRRDPLLERSRNLCSRGSLSPKPLSLHLALYTMESRLTNRKSGTSLHLSFFSLLRAAFYFRVAMKLNEPLL